MFRYKSIQKLYVVKHDQFDLTLASKTYIRHRALRDGVSGGLLPKCFLPLGLGLGAFHYSLRKYGFE